MKRRTRTGAHHFDGLCQQVAGLALPVHLGLSRRRVEHQASRETGEDEVGERRFAITAVRAWARRDALDRPAELVAQEPRPPSRRQPVEHLQRVGARFDANGIGCGGDDETGSVAHDGGVDGVGEGGEQRGGARRRTGGHLRPGGGHTGRVAAARGVAPAFRATEESAPAPVA